MPVKEAIILAGGLGTRLKNVLRDIPKPMAPINGQPFLEILIRYLTRQGLERIVLATGYQANLIEEYFIKHQQKIKISYSVEKEPLGTGGCIKKALALTCEENILIINGDTFFDVNINELLNKHAQFNADATLTLKYILDCSRYGAVELDSNGKIIAFREKSNEPRGFISGGVSIIKKHLLNQMPDKFSFEKDFITAHLNKAKLYGYISNGYFIDIGVPKDYEKAKKELKQYQ